MTCHTEQTNYVVESLAIQLASYSYHDDENRSSPERAGLFKRFCTNTDLEPKIFCYECHYESMVDGRTSTGGKFHELEWHSKCRQRLLPCVCVHCNPIGIAITQTTSWRGICDEPEYYIFPSNQFHSIHLTSFLYSHAFSFLPID